MKVLGGLQLGEKSSLINLTVPIGDQFPSDENIGELFFVRRGSIFHKPGLYICQDNEEGALVWKLLVDASAENLEYPVIELGTTEPLNIYSSSQIPLRWDFRSILTDNCFEHTTVGPESSVVKIKRDGMYQISYSVSSEKESSGTQILCCGLRLNGKNLMGRSVTYSYRGGSSLSSNTNTVMARLYAGMEVELVCFVLMDNSWFGSRRTMTVSDNCSLSFTRIGEAQ